MRKPAFVRSSNTGLRPCGMNSPTWAGSSGSVILWSAAMRRIHWSDLMDIASGSLTRCATVVKRAVLRRRRCSRVLDDDARELRRKIGGLLRDGHGNFARNGLVDLRRRTIGIRDDGGSTGIGLLANADIERQRAEKRHVVFAAHLFGAAFAEDVFGVTAVRADVDRHVFDDADDGYAHLLEHLQPLARIDQRDVLRRRQ